MQFICTEWRRLDNRRGVQFPFLHLGGDDWDDYRYKTLYWATLHLSEGEEIDLGSVKIARIDQGFGRTELPKSVFDELPEGFCSLGQSYEYYEKLHQLGAGVFEPLLVGLRDLVFDGELRAQVGEEKVVEISFLRFGEAQVAWESGPALFRGSDEASEGSALRFELELSESDDIATFDYGGAREIPNRVAAIIGYNGVGKTRFLAGLATAAMEERSGAGLEDPADAELRFYGARPPFGGVIAVSFSAFDTFELPGAGGSRVTGIERDPLSSGKTMRNYTYCGLRRLDADGAASTELKSVSDLDADFETARARAIQRGRQVELERCLDVLREEPSLSMIAELPLQDASTQEWREVFQTLSTGHKIACLTLMHLFAALDKSSLVLLDEPEMHLHPPLVAALLRAINGALVSFDSHAVVATHSPVVLQEIPASRVLVLRRSVDGVAIGKPEIETFGESVGLITRHVFNLDSRATDFQGVLDDLASTHSADEIDALFPGGLSSQARALVYADQLSRE